MIKIKKILLITIVIIGILFGGCATLPKSVENVETESVKENLEIMNQQVGMPFIQNYFEKKMAKQIFELRDKSDLITYAYTTNLEGRYIYLGKCVGFGLPYSVQYTNPEKLTRGSHWGTTIPQADPNGLYMPEGLSATWLMLINEETNKTEIIYAEPEIIVTQSKLPKRLVAEWSLTDNY